MRKRGEADLPMMPSKCESSVKSYFSRYARRSGVPSTLAILPS
jgi:hypothetical protein